MTGVDTPQHRIENKCRRKALLASQSPKTQWTIYQGEFELPPPKELLATHRAACAHLDLPSTTRPQNY